MSALQEEDILRISKAQSIKEIRSLQCWGKNIQDITSIIRASNLEILNLSCNNIENLEGIEKCLALRHLYLRKNKIATFEELRHLKPLSNLRALWLIGNPISSQPNYRTTVAQMLPQLQQIDQSVITDSEREAKAFVLPNSQQEKKTESCVCSAILTLLPLLEDDHSINLISNQLQHMMAQRTQ